MREDVVMIATEAKRRQISGNIRRHVAPDIQVRQRACQRVLYSMHSPALLLVAIKKICNSGPAGMEMMSSTEATPPDTKSRIMRKVKPVAAPIMTQ